MNVFFDEDNGTGIPKAIALVRLPGDTIHYPSDKGHQVVRRGAKDRDWIPVVGDAGWLVFSQNKLMLNNEEERSLLVQHRIGVVFLADGTERAFPVLRLVLAKWEWFRLIDSTMPRPFAYLLTLGGQARRLDVHSSAPLGSRARLPGVRVSTAVSVTTPSAPAPTSSASEARPSQRARLPGF